MTKKDSRNPCREMANNNAKQMQILCIGKLDSRLILITHDYLVYELPLQSIGTTIGRLYVGNIKPIPIAKKWPNLARTKGFKIAMENFYNAFTAFDSNGEYLLFTTKWLKCECVGITYDIVHDRVYTGLSYMGPDDQVILSSNELSKFYAINKIKSDGGLQISQYRFVQDSVPISKIENTLWVEHFYRICSLGSEKLMIVTDRNAPCNPVTWPILNGFVSDERFYLFGSNYIIVFPQSAYEKPNQSALYQKIPFSDFIQCNGSVNLLNSNDGRDNFHGGHYSIYIIMSIVLLILLLCLFCILCLLRETIARKRKKRKKKRKKTNSIENTNSINRHLKTKSYRSRHSEPIRSIQSGQTRQKKQLSNTLVLRTTKSSLSSNNLQNIKSRKYVSRTQQQSIRSVLEKNSK